jgi:hypothetical protein
MIMKFVAYNNVNQLSCSHTSKQKVIQCYGIGSEIPYTTADANSAATWIKLTPQSYKITSANFYTSQVKLIPDRYISLVSQFRQQPLQLQFIKVVSTPCGKTFVQAGDISSVTKQAARKIDSLFITFYYHPSAKAVCIKPYIENFKLTDEEAGNTTYPGGGISMNIGSDHVQYQML